jgi:hypothetical protein
MNLDIDDEQPAAIQDRQRRLRHFLTPKGDPEIAYRTIAFDCHLGAALLMLEGNHGIDAATSDDEWVRVIDRPRYCKYFEPYVPLMSFRDHLDKKEKRSERLLVAGGAVVGAVLGGIGVEAIRAFA